MQSTSGETNISRSFNTSVNSYSAKPMKMMRDTEHDHNKGVPAKRPKVENKCVTSVYSTSYSAESMQMMRKMGHDPNKGLGKSGQGIIEPVAASDHKGRRGLGLKLEGLDAAAGKFKESKETVSINEVIEWLPNNANDLNGISLNVLHSWCKSGHRLLTIDNEGTFCDPAVLREILDSKTIFDKIDRDELRRARSRSNPFETIRGSIFLNRTAVKMVSPILLTSDSFIWMLTMKQPQSTLYGETVAESNFLLKFAKHTSGPLFIASKSPILEPSYAWTSCVL